MTVTVTVTVTVTGLKRNNNRSLSPKISSDVALFTCLVQNYTQKKTRKTQKKPKNTFTLIKPMHMHKLRK